MPRKKENRKKISLNVDEADLAWIDQKIEEKIFDNRGHAIRRAISKLTKNGEYNPSGAS